jgi:hypothetical protein
MKDVSGAVNMLNELKSGQQQQERERKRNSPFLTNEATFLVCHFVKIY